MFPRHYPFGSLGCDKLEPYPWCNDGDTLAMYRAQVGITEDINYECLCSLLESKNSCALC
jgi:hypothetical protein